MHKADILKSVSDDDIILELQTRGWTYKEVRIPYQIPGPRDGPTYLARQLQHSDRDKG